MTDPAVAAAWITGGLGLLASGLGTVIGTIKTNRKLKTKNGKTIAEHVEDLVTWSHIHTEQDNEIRDALGIARAAYPDLRGWKNEG